jgi:hypothetical protein
MRVSFEGECCTALKPTQLDVDLNAAQRDCMDAGG